MAGTTVEQVQQCGVVGAGGAGFPTHVKLQASADTIILNAAECEPLLHKDKELLRCFGDDVLAGLESARQLVGAGEAIVGVKGKYIDVIEQLRVKLPERHRIVELTDTYPAGDEFILVYDTTGRIIAPGAIPLSVGCVVTNVETMLNVARREPVTTKYLTVAGAVASPVTLAVPVGTTFAQCIALAGAATVDDPVALVGGAMMGELATDFDEVVTKTTGGLLVLDRSHPLHQRHAADWSQIRRIGTSACDQCSFCTELCPRYLLGHPIEPHKAMRSLAFNQMGEAAVQGTDFCCECNLCTMMACPEGLDPKNVCAQNKRRRAANGQRWGTPPTAEIRAQLHLPNRRTPIGRLIRKLGLGGFTNKGPMLTHDFTPSRVRLPLQQHIGVPARPTVQVGQTVSVGDQVAAPPAGALGAPIHASIAGGVTGIDGEITIEA